MTKSTAELLVSLLAQVQISVPVLSPEFAEQQARIQQARDELQAILKSLITSS